MTQPISSETIDYERHMDGLRRTNAQMLTALKDIILWAERHGLAKADLITGGRAEVPVITNARTAVALAEEVPTSAASTITVHVEGGMVADVTGIPAGYEVRVEDYDEGDASHPAWNPQKECFVTVYDGGTHA